MSLPGECRLCSKNFAFFNELAEIDATRDSYTTNVKAEVEVEVESEVDVEWSGVERCVVERSGVEWRGVEWSGRGAETNSGGWG